MPIVPSFENVEMLIAQSQTLLIEFLRSDVALAFTFLGIAQTHKESDPARYRGEIHKAKAAVDTIRKFEGRIQDPNAWSDIHEHGNQLEAAIQQVESGGVDG